MHTWPFDQALDRVAAPCGQVRWAFDILATRPTRFDYVEDVHPPALQSLYTTELDPSCSAVPVVQLVDSASGEVSVVKDSTAILKRTAPFLYPEGRAEAIDRWEQAFDGRLGPAVRVYAYEHFMAKPARPVLKRIANHGAPLVEGWLFSLAIDSGFLEPNMRRFMGISAESAVRCRADIDAIFEEVGAALEGGSKVRTA